MGVQGQWLAAHGAGGLGGGGVAGDGPFPGWDMMYVAAVGKTAHIDSIFVCNTDASNERTFKLAVAPASDADPEDEFYLYKDYPLPPGETFRISGPIILYPGQVIGWDGSTDDIEVVMNGEIKS